MNVKTDYMGLKLRTPLVVSASPLTESLDNIKRLKDAGASAIVLYSLFEGQIHYERYKHHWTTTHGTESYPEALSYLPEPHELFVRRDIELESLAVAPNVFYSSRCRCVGLRFSTTASAPAWLPPAAFIAGPMR